MIVGRSRSFFLDYFLNRFSTSFRCHEQFAFQVFGVFQKRQVCRSVALQVKKEIFVRQGALIKSLTAADFRRASVEEAEGKPFSHEGIRSLRQHLSASRRHVLGTDESRLSMRSKSWSTTAAFGPPSLWITINPSDQDPIAQVFAGADIDLDRFDATKGPSSTQRGRNMASDPFASAKFFHFMINTLLEVVFGIKKTSSGLQRSPGIFGSVRAYIGSVEAQGRGTLHLHMLVWLMDAPTGSVMREALMEETFQQRIRSFIEATIHADIDENNLAEILQLPKLTAVSYSRPISPITQREDSILQVKGLARTVQLHTCHLSTCLRIVNGRRECKRKAPFSLSPQAWVNSNGEWGPKRLCSNLNNWNPWLLRCLRSNHDVKLIMNGTETCVLVLYTTNYACKKQSRSSNTTALLADKLAVASGLAATCDNVDQDTLLTANKRLLQRCAHSLLTQREFSGPEIMSYLMGWGDRFESHVYVCFYVDAAMRALKHAFPMLASSAIPGMPQNGGTTLVSELFVNFDQPLILWQRMRLRRQ